MKKNVRNRMKKIIMAAGMMCMLLNAVGVSSNMEIGAYGEGFANKGKINEYLCQNRL